MVKGVLQAKIKNKLNNIKTKLNNQNKFSII